MTMEMMTLNLATKTAAATTALVVLATGELQNMAS
jgi:hypothetical protein